MSSASSASSALLQGISSMATRQVLADLAADWQAQGGTPVHITSVGGVDAAQRVRSGEALDVVLLASDAIDALLASGHALAGSKRDWVLSSTAVAVPAGAALPDIGSAAALRAAVLAAPSIGYSTGPSGVALLRLFEHWGLTQTLQARLVQARPGVPVGQLLAQGEVALGFQQLSELLHLPGITVVGELPPDVAIDTIFSGAVVSGSAQAEAAQRLLDFLASPATTPAKQRQGMRPAPPTP